MTDVAAHKPSPPLALVERVVGLLDGVPYTLLALPLRAAAATVFWNSAQASRTGTRPSSSSPTNIRCRCCRRRSPPTWRSVLN
jgi:hypothetical protein